MKRTTARRSVHFAGALALVAALTAAAPAAGPQSVRSLEWPLNTQHFDAARVLRLSTGSGVVVAVVDSGVDADHPDLAGRVLAGVNLVADGVADGRTDSSLDSHGTSIAALIAGSGTSEQGQGVLGLAPGAQILPVRVSAGSQVDPGVLAEGIDWAAEHGARVINVSSGSPAPDPRVAQAVAYAQAHDCVVVASAGNDAYGGDPVLYPAGSPGVVAVTGSTASNTFWADGESGREVDLAAPAQNIESANNTGQFLQSDGTSYSAAYVSATAALIAGRYPKLTANQIIQRLIHTASDAKSPNTKMGYGEVNPLGALAADVSDSSAGNPLLLRSTYSATSRAGQGLATGFVATATVLLVVAAALVIRRRRSAAEPARAKAVRHLHLPSQGQPKGASTKGRRQH